MRVFLSLILVLCYTVSAQEPAQRANPNGSTSSEATSQKPLVQPGRLINEALPDYPKEARKHKLQGSVSLRLLVGKDGSVTSVETIAGDPLLAAPAAYALKNRKYEPLLGEGQPLDSEILTTVYFALPRLGPTVFAVDDRDAGSNAPEPTKIGKGVVPPHIIYAPDPSYTEKAKRENFQGVSVLSLIIGKDGRAHHIKPVRIIGDGLDQKAIDAVSQWKFQPATKDGQPVSVFVTVEVAFHLY